MSCWSPIFFRFCLNRFAVFLQRQERLLFVCFYILLSVSEDVGMDISLKQKKIVRYLLNTLRRESVAQRREVFDDLVVLCLTYLRKLSIYRENIDEMVGMACVGDDLILTVPSHSQGKLNC